MIHSQSSEQKDAFLPQEEHLEIRKKNKKVIIGLPKEKEKGENRVALTPQAVQLLINNGNQVYVEQGAGTGSNYSDIEYSKAGAVILNDSEMVFKSDMIVKINPLTLEEIDYLSEGQTIFSTLHINSQTKKQIEAIRTKRVRAIAYEYLRDQYNSLPVVRSMSEISGILSVTVAAEYLSNANNGKGILLGGITGISPSEVLILGAGEASLYAAKAAIGLGAIVKIFDSSLFHLKNIQQQLGQNVFTSIIQPQVLTKALRSADVVIGAIDGYERANNCYITKEMVSKMKRGAVIVDLNIDNVSCFESSHLTTHSNPVFVKHGVIHYCVPNIASRAARTASVALSNVLAPIILNISENGGVAPCLKINSGLRAGTYLYNGILTNSYIGKKFGLNFKDINLIMAAF